MVRVEWRERVVVVTLDRPERRNAVDHPTLVALAEAQQEAAAGGARVLVLTGTPPAFCAGADLNGVDGDEFGAALATALRGFTRLGMITLAAVDGPALGAGTQLVVACDLRIATGPSVFGIPAAKLGLAVDRWTIDRLAREFGPAIARSMLLAAQQYRTEQLQAAGGVHRIGDLHDALRWADELATLAPLTVRAHKLGLELGAGAGAGADIDIDIDVDVAAFEAARTAAWSSADAEEGRRAFLEKRYPAFEGR